MHVPGSVLILDSLPTLRRWKVSVHCKFQYEVGVHLAIQTLVSPGRAGCSRSISAVVTISYHGFIARGGH
jgi:hypothetical protein